jgi:GNAT superfamily N-acetyltransferase
VFEIAVRQAAPWDSDRLRAIGKEAWLSGHRHLFTQDELDQVQAAQTDDIFGFDWEVPKSGITVVASVGPNLVGAATLRPYPSNGLPGLIEPMSVIPGFQRHGVGTAIWNYVVALARQRTYPGLRVFALTGNQMAVGFYTKMGCRVVGRGELRLGEHVEPATGFQLDFA